jgi:hypothetical protein
MRLPRLREIGSTSLFLDALLRTHGFSDTDRPNDQRKISQRTQDIDILRPWIRMFLLQQWQESRNTLSRRRREGIPVGKALDD